MGIRRCGHRAGSATGLDIPGGSIHPGCLVTIDPRLWNSGNRSSASLPRSTTPMDRCGAASTRMRCQPLRRATRISPTRASEPHADCIGRAARPSRSAAATRCGHARARVAPPDHHGARAALPAGLARHDPRSGDGSFGRCDERRRTGPRARWSSCSRLNRERPCQQGWMLMISVRRPRNQSKTPLRICRWALRRPGHRTKRACAC